MQKNEISAFRGVITPISWDKQNRIKSFGVYTHEGEDIPIVNRDGKESSKLMKYLNQKVKVYGAVSELPDHEHRVISVRKIIKENKMTKSKHKIKKCQPMPQEIYYSDEFNILFPQEDCPYSC
ncbi:MAG: hypothetical protein HQK50_03650 [Oligoflexia bacterium]|nr:hypothetical protein [Oligoflexia bacterium]MBF0364638.1 hypothetical protein [Oligoflexia bacterium]